MEITLTVPDEAVAAIRRILTAEEVEGKLGPAVFQLWLNRELASPVKAYVRQQDVLPAIAAEEETRIKMEDAFRVERQARLDAEAAADAKAALIEVT